MYADYFQDYMNANLSDWSTYVIEGNHDFGLVMNSQDFSTTDPMITYNLNLWRKYLTPEAQEEFARHGFYS